MWLLLVAPAAFAASPLSPAQERTTFQLADSNLVVELAAAEPDVRAPVAIAWDADARLFVAEMTDYPSGPVSGRIRLLEDRDDDGRYERSMVFATNLAFPNGVLPWRNGVLVTAAPDIWFLADTNGDGAADVRERILTGFAEGNQQLRVNGLTHGLDNWIYGANGRSDGEVKWADGTPAGSIRRRDFRFRPDEKRFEAVSGNSQFGMGYDDWGNRFPVFNNTPIRHVVLEERYLARQPLLAGIDVVPSASPASDGNRVFAVTPPNLMIPQAIGFFTSACGPSVYRGTAMPLEYAGNYFVCEPVQNLVQRRVLRANGSTFVAEYAHAGTEFLASSDPWFHGVFTATGPDGALYIVDFYRDLVEHPHWVAPELRDKIEWRKGEEHGRIWRIAAKGARRAKAPRLSQMPEAALVRALEHDNGWVRDTAHRLLVERQASGARASLERLARSGKTAQSRVHALHVLDGLKTGVRSPAGAREDSVVLDALRDPSPRVREHAVQLAERRLAAGAGPKSQLVTAVAGLAADSDARVRLQLAAAMGGVKDESVRRDVLAKLASHRRLDRWQSIAILSSEPEPWRLMTLVLEGSTASGSEQIAFLERAAELVAAGTNTSHKRELVGWLTRAKRVDRIAIAAAFAARLPKGESLERLAPKAAIEELLQVASAVCTDSSTSLDIRLAAVQLVPAQQAAALALGSDDEALRLAAARAVAQSGRTQEIRQVFQSFNQLPKPVRRQFVALSPRSRVAALELVRAVGEGAVPLLEVDPATRLALEKSADAEVKARAQKLFRSAASPDREAVIEKFRPALRLAGNRKRGAEIYERSCMVCHQMQGVGAKVGPDLSGTGQQPRETLLVQILDPSRQVLPDFVAHTVTTRSGDAQTGFIAAETAASLTLRRANEPDVTFPRADIANVATSGQSLMPEGLEAGMALQDMADLIEFLRRPDRTLFTQSK
jgi:putative membrane-bound dehydrogenase-like protein